MRLRTGSLAMLVLLAACGSSAAGTTRPATSTGETTTAPARPPDCGPPGARTLAYSAEARAYTTRGVVYGCSVPRRRSFRLTTLAFFRHTHLDHIAAAGRMVAYGVTAFGVDTGATNVLVRRLSDGMLLGSYSATNLGFAESFSSIGSLVVKRDGAVAWIGQVSSIARRSRTMQVFAAKPPAATPRQLDSGVGIAASSLRLEGSTLSWRHGTATRHATL